jgi:hypothetical protein
MKPVVRWSIVIAAAGLLARLGIDPETVRSRLARG